MTFVAAPLPTRSPHQYLCENPLAIQYRDQCYTVNTPRRGKSWSDASAECQRVSLVILRLMSKSETN